MIVNVIKNHQPDRSPSWSLLIPKVVEAIRRKIRTNLSIMLLKGITASCDMPMKENIRLILNPTRNIKGKNAVHTKRCAHQYSDLLDLPLKSIHFTKYALTEFKKLIKKSHWISIVQVLNKTSHKLFYLISNALEFVLLTIQNYLCENSWVYTSRICYLVNSFLPVHQLFTNFLFMENWGDS